MIFVACAILEAEVKSALAEMGRDDEVIFVDPGLHVDNDRLKESLQEKLKEAAGKGEKIALIFGNACHPEMAEIAAEYKAKIGPKINCLELLLGDEMKKLNAECNTYFLSGGWMKNWQKIFAEGLKWDTYDARQNFGFYDRTLLLDSGVDKVEDEDLLEFFEYSQAPIEPMAITLDHLKEQIKLLSED